MDNATHLRVLVICAAIAASALLGCDCPLLNGGPGAPVPGNGDEDGNGNGPSNTPPTVVASADQVAREGFPVNLDAQISDADGDPLTVDWEQLAGAPVLIVVTSQTAIEFDAPVVNSLAEASLAFQVTVKDDRGGQASDTVNVRVILAGDVIIDDVVDELDRQRVEELFEAGGQPGPDDEGDLNVDGRVDGRDLSIVLENFGRSL